MDNTPTLIGKNVIIYIRGGFRYSGTIQDIDDRFFYLRDIKINKDILINRTEVTTLEVLE